MKDLIERGFAPGCLQSQLSHLDKASEIVWNYKLSQKFYRVKAIIAQWRRGYVPKQVKILDWVKVFPVVTIASHILFFLHDEMYIGVGLIFCASYFRLKYLPRKPWQDSSQHSIGPVHTNSSVRPMLLYAI